MSVSTTDQLVPFCPNIYALLLQAQSLVEVRQPIMIAVKKTNTLICKDHFATATYKCRKVIENKNRVEKVVATSPIGVNYLAPRHLFLTYAVYSTGIGTQKE